MQYLIKEGTFSAGAINEQIRLTRVRFSHLMIKLIDKGTVPHTSAEMIADLKKLVINSSVSGFASQKKNITDCLAWDFATLTDMSGGVGYSATELGARLFIPLGDYNLQESDIIIDINTSSNLTKDIGFRVTALRLADNMERLEYLRRTVSTDGLHFARVLQMYDVNVNIAGTEVKSIITFTENDTQATVRHNTAYDLTQAVSQVEAVNTYGCIFSDKDVEEGRSIRVQPDAQFTAFAIQYSTLN